MDDQTNTPQQNPNIPPEPTVIVPNVVPSQPSSASVNTIDPANTQPAIPYIPMPQTSLVMSHNSVKRKKPIIPIMAIAIVLFLAVDVYLFRAYKNKVPEDTLKQVTTKTSDVPSASPSSPQSPAASTPVSAGSPSSPTATTNPQTATETARIFITALQANKSAEVDAMLSPDFKEEMKQQIGKPSYYETCGSECAVRLVNLSKAVVSNEPYKSADGTAGEIITFKTPRLKGGFDFVSLTILKVNGKYVVDAESNGTAVN